jgi:uncharacterized protein YlxW (UPF0749 family)
MTTPDAAEPPEPESTRDLLRQLAFQPGRPHLLIGLLFIILGLLITVVIVKPSSDAPWQTARTEDLVQILDGLGARQDRLDAESARLTALETDLERGSTEEALNAARRNVAAMQVLAGTTPVTGPGLTITMNDPEGVVDAPLLIDAVQELRDAGAEAIQVGSSRVVADTWFGDSAQGPVVEGTPIPNPVTIAAIGDPDTMAAAMSIPGGLADSVRTRGADFAATPAQSMTISVTVPNIAE